MIQQFSKENISQRNPSSLDIKSHYKPTKTFQYVHFTSFRPSGVKRSFIKGEEIRKKIRKNSSKKKNLRRVSCELEAHECSKPDIERSLSGVNLDSRHRDRGLKQKQKNKERLLPFVTTYNPAVQDLKKTLMANWSLQV